MESYNLFDDYLSTNITKWRIDGYLLRSYIENKKCLVFALDKPANNFKWLFTMPSIYNTVYLYGGGTNYKEITDYLKGYFLDRYNFSLFIK